MNIFGETPVPAWKGPADDRRINEAIGDQYGDTFNKGFMSQYNKVEERAYQEQEKQKTVEALKPVIQGLSGAKSWNDTADLVVQHPEWLLNDKTAPFVQKAMGVWDQAEKIRVGAATSIAARKRFDYENSFLNGEAELKGDAATSREDMIKAGTWYAPSKDGNGNDYNSISENGKAVIRKYRADNNLVPLGVTSTSSEVRGFTEAKKDTRQQASLKANALKAQSPLGKLFADKEAAVQRGATPQELAAYDAKLNVEKGMPQQTVLDNGDIAAWMPGSTTMHILKDKSTEAKAKAAYDEFRGALRVQTDHAVAEATGKIESSAEAKYKLLDKVKQKEKAYFNLFKPTTIPVPDAAQQVEPPDNQDETTSPPDTQPQKIGRFLVTPQ